MSSLLVVCLVTLYAAWKVYSIVHICSCKYISVFFVVPNLARYYFQRIPDLLLPYLLYKVLLILWLSVYLSVLVIDDKSALDFGPDIYPFRFLIEKETKVREDNTLFPVFLFIVSLEIIGKKTTSTFSNE
jgi:hypothetical protein